MAIIRAADERKNETVRFGSFEVDLDGGQVVKHGIRIGVREQSFQVLALLLRRPGKIVTRDEIRQKLWHDGVFVDFDKSLNTAVARLRQALGDSADHPRFIETLPKRGYRFVAPVSTTLEATPASVPNRGRLLVLPFINLNGDPEQDYFCDAITDEVITELAAIAPEDLAVIARTTAMHYKGSHKDVGRIGRELAIDYVLEGGVRASSGRIGINVQLIQVHDQAHVFAKKYETELRDVFEVESTIAQAVAARIGVNFSEDKGHAGGAARRTPKLAVDVAAYDAYMRGRSLLGSWTAEGLARAKQFFEIAISREQQFALAHDGLAETYAWLGFNGFIRPKDGFSAAVFSALRAIEIDPGLAQTHALLGMLRSQLDYNWAEVDREMALALELDPGSPVVRFRYAASGLLPHGRMDEAIAEVQRALESDPLSLFMRAWLAQYFILMRQYDRTIEECQKIISLDPGYFFSYLALGEVLCERGLYSDAISQLRKAAGRSGNAPLVLGYLGMALARSGDFVSARSVLADLYDAASQLYIPPTSLGTIHLGLGEIDKVFTCLERAIDDRDPIIIPIKTDPSLDPLRADPRFTALLRKMNLES
ncbi:MAG TPA: winged helix-turn-helix domain-containing protein [Terriglobales bacterium]|nr:winged helix-turn-helix domain-containing protein [Terriglobales bacterium]